VLHCDPTQRPTWGRGTPCRPGRVAPFSEKNACTPGSKAPNYSGAGAHPGIWHYFMQALAAPTLGASIGSTLNAVANPYCAMSGRKDAIELHVACSLWVISGHLIGQRECPLCAKADFVRTDTTLMQDGQSAVGTKGGFPRTNVVAVILLRVQPRTAPERASHPKGGDHNPEWGVPIPIRCACI
jgi:hypothetical protein